MTEFFPVHLFNKTERRNEDPSIKVNSVEEHVFAAKPGYTNC